MAFLNSTESSEHKTLASKIINAINEVNYEKLCNSVRTWEEKNKGNTNELAIAVNDLIEGLERTIPNFTPNLSNTQEILIINILSRKKKLYFSRKKWWVIEGSNLRPLRCQRNALTN